MTGEVRRWRAERVVPAAGSLAEGPCWDDRRGVLRWVDIPAGVMHVWRPGDPPDRVEHVRFDRPVGCMAPTTSGRWLLALETGAALADVSDPGSPAVDLIGEHAPRPVPIRYNDGGTDPRGRFFAGTQAYDETPGAAALYRLEPDGFRPVRGGATISNGLDWSDDGRTLYYVDSPRREVLAIAYDPETGVLGEERAWRRFGDPEGVVPDGLCLDAEDHVWVAMHGGGCVRRLDPSGATVGEVEIGADPVTSMAFGGPQFDELFVTTAGDGLFACRVGVRGRPARRADDSPWIV